MLDPVLNNYAQFNEIPVRGRRRRNNQGNNANVAPPVPGAVADRRRIVLRNIRNRGRVVAQRSPAEITLLKLLKKRRDIGNAAQFRRVFERDVARNPTDGTLAFFYELFRSSNFDIKKLGIESNLYKNPIKVPFYATTQTDYISSDSILWYRVLNTVRNNRAFFNVFNNIDSVMVSSMELITFAQERNIAHYFVEDFDPEVCAVSVLTPLNPPMNQNELADMNEDFTFDGKMYKTLAFNRPNANAVIFTNANIPLDRLVGIVNNQKILTSKKSLVRGLRVTRENPGAYYFNSKIKPTTFCPSVFGGFNPTNFGSLIMCEINPNDFISFCIQDGDFTQIPNFINWDSMESSVELLIITLLATDVFNGVVLQPMILEQCRIFFEFKGFFLAMKKLYKKFERIVLLYIDSFKTRVSIDRMRKIITKCDEYIALHREIWENVELYNTVREFVNAFEPICEYMYRFLVNGNPIDLIYTIRETCGTVNDTTMPIDAFQEKIRGTAYACYRTLANSDTPVIPTIRSPSCFLGNLKGNYDVAELRLFATAARNQAIERIRNVGNVGWNQGNFNDIIQMNLIFGPGNVPNQNEIANLGLLGINNINDLNRLIQMFPNDRRNDLGIVFWNNINNRVIAADAGQARVAALELRRRLFPNIDQIVAAGFAYADNEIDNIHNLYIQMRDLQNRMRNPNVGVPNIVPNINVPNPIPGMPNINVPNPIPNVPNPNPNAPNPNPNVPNPGPNPGAGGGAP